jgi:DNA processing protein
MSDTDGAAKDRWLATFSRLTSADPGVQAGTLAGRSHTRDETAGGRNDQGHVGCERVFGLAEADVDILRERAAVLALAAAAGDEPHRAAVAIEVIGSALGLLNGDRSNLEEWEAEFADQLCARVSESDIERWTVVIAAQRRAGVDVVTVLDDVYPVNLRMVHDLPAAMFVRGTLPAGRRSVAIAGSSQPSSDGIRWAGVAAGTLAAAQMSVVAGLRAGIDTAAHRAAGAAGGRSVAVLDSGIDLIQMPQARPLAVEIVRRGALVSPFWPGAARTDRTLLRSAAVISGLAACVVVVEGSPDPDAAALARLAFDQARTVFFVAGLSAEEAWSKAYLERGLGRVVGSNEELIDSVRRLTEPHERSNVT